MLKKILLSSLVFISISSYAATSIIEETSGTIFTSKAKANTSMPGMTVVNGKVKNNDSVKHSFAVTVTFLDENNDIIGTAVGAVNDLASGQTKTYQAMGQQIQGKYTQMEVQVDSII